MKRIVLLLAVVLIGLSALAQRNSVITVAPDTLTNAETINIDVVELRANQEVISITAEVTQLTGTAAGTLTLQASLDGTNWFIVNGVGAGVLTASPQASITGAALNSLTIADGLIGSWVVNKNSYRHYRIVAAGSGTQSTQIDIKYKYQ